MHCSQSTIDVLFPISKGFSLLLSHSVLNNRYTAYNLTIYYVQYMDIPYFILVRVAGT